MSTRTTGRALPVVAIDGPGGSGKSTVARLVATRLGWRYLDSGALYRAVTVGVLDAGLDPADAAAAAGKAHQLRLEISTDPADQWVTLDGEPVTSQIRTRTVTNNVSAVSAVPAVRETLLQLQRRLIGEGHIVVEGRDIGTTVLPDAEVKIFLTADPAARAERRHRDMDEPPELATTHDEIARRDALDTGRTVSPLAIADDAYEIDTTLMTIEEVVSAVLARCESLTAVNGAMRSQADA